MAEQHYIIPPTPEGSVDPHLRAEIDSIIADARMDQKVNEAEIVRLFGDEIAIQEDIDRLRMEADETVFEKAKWGLSA